MTIAELAGSGKASLDRVKTTWLIVGIVLLSATGSFGLGVLQGREMGKGSDLSITELATTTPPANVVSEAAPPAVSQTAAAVVASPATLPAGGQVVASKNGTKYYLPWCAGVKRIKEENKVWFATKEAAEAAGYGPASNCKGL